MECTANTRLTDTTAPPIWLRCSLQKGEIVNLQLQKSDKSMSKVISMVEQGSWVEWNQGFSEEYAFYLMMLPVVTHQTQQTPNGYFPTVLVKPAHLQALDQDMHVHDTFPSSLLPSMTATFAKSLALFPELRSVVQCQSQHM